MLKNLLLLATLVMATLTSSCVTINQRPPDPKVMKSVSHVKLYLKQLHGKTVRVTGEINECISLTCQICDGPSESDACLPLNLYAYSPTERRLVEELYRFARITVDARVDATCELGHYPDLEKPTDFIEFICTDRSSALEDAHVVSVDERQPARAGRFDGYKGGLLQEADAATYDTIGKLLASMNPYDKGDEYHLRENGIRVYNEREPEPLPDGSKYFYVCMCGEHSCEGRWPEYSGQAVIPSPANPYICSTARKVGDNWLLNY